MDDPPPCEVLSGPWHLPDDAPPEEGPRTPAYPSYDDHGFPPDPPIVRLLTGLVGLLVAFLAWLVFTIAVEFARIGPGG